MLELPGHPEGTTADGAVHELLAQLLEHRFVLTDRAGAVTRWSRPAELLFNWDVKAALG